MIKHGAFIYVANSEYTLFSTSTNTDDWEMLSTWKFHKKNRVEIRKK